jgi:hypothetical protein
MPNFVSKSQHQVVPRITLKPTVLFHRYLLLHICLYYYCCCYFRLFLTYANYLMTDRTDLYVKLSDVILVSRIVLLLAVFPLRSVSHSYILIFRSKVKWPLYRPGVAQRVGRGIALLFHDHGTRRGWVASITPRPLFTSGKDPVSIVQEAGWAPGPVWTGAENLASTGIRSRTVQPVAQSLYRLSYRAHQGVLTVYILEIWRVCI